MKYSVMLICAVVGVLIIRYTAFSNLDIKYWNQFWYLAFNTEGLIFRFFYEEPEAMVRLVKSGTFLKSLAGFIFGGFVGWLMFFSNRRREKQLG